MIYISGAVSSDKNYREKFDKAEKYLISKGYEVVNPVKGESEGKSWDYYMKKDIKKLLECDSIYLLNDYIKSRGALLELKIALELGYTLIKEGEI